ncbi:MAG: SigE family RNA polymerase sigma factor [Mycobacteriales bacterium]
MRSTGVEVPFEDFVLARGPALVRFAYALCGDAHLAEDLVQEVLARTSSRWGRLQPSPEPYLRTAIARELISWRRRRSHGERPSDIPDHSGGHAADEIVDRDPLWRLLAGLPARQRAVLVLRHYEALPDREIAALLGCRDSTVRSLAARGAAALRAHPDLAYLSDSGTRHAGSPDQDGARS